MPRPPGPYQSDASDPSRTLGAPRPSDAGAAQVLFLVRYPRMRVDQFAGSVLSEMCQRPVHESRQFRLMSCTGFGKRLLKLASRSAQSNAHHIGGSL
jgi:hypothetical protein